MSYKLRIHIERSGCTAEDVLAWVKSKSNCYLICREMAATPAEHCHAYFQHHDTQKAALRASIKTKLIKTGLKGNTVYSFKKCDDPPIKFLAYLVKGGDYIHSGLDVWLAQALAYDESVKAEMSNRRRVIDIIEERVKPYLDQRCYSYRKEICAGIVDHYIDRGITFNKFKVESAFMYLMCKHDPEFKSKFISSITENF